MAKIVITKAALKYIEGMSKEDKDFLKTICQAVVVTNVLKLIVQQAKKRE